MYQFRVMPFGLCNAPATFQRLMEAVLAGLHWSTCLVYLDDTLIFSKTLEEHFDKLRDVFERLRRAGLKIKPEKCHIFRKEVQYLGHIVSEKRYCNWSQQIETVLNWPTPTCVQELKQFMEFASYYRRFVPNFPKFATPHRLTEKGSKWYWNAPEQEAFMPHQFSCSCISSNFNSRFLLMLMPVVLDWGLSKLEEKKRLSHMPAVLWTSPKENTVQLEKEMLALVWAIKHFKPYLYRSPFYSENRPCSPKMAKELQGTWGPGCPMDWKVTGIWLWCDSSGWAETL